MFSRSSREFQPFSFSPRVSKSAVIASLYDLSVPWQQLSCALKDAISLILQSEEASHRDWSIRFTLILVSRDNEDVSFFQAGLAALQMFKAQLLLTLIPGLRAH